jgi:hypothetical protein
MLTRAALVLVVLAGTAHAQRGGKKPPKPPPPPPAVVVPEPAKPKPPPTGKERIVGILDVRGPTAGDEATFEKSLEEQLDTKTYWLAPRATMRERLRNSTKWTDGCLVHSCLAEVKVQTDADVVILAALTGSGTSFGFVVTVLRTDSGKVIAQESQRCDVCTFNETMNTAVLATIRLLRSIPPVLPDEAAQDRAAVALAVQNAVQPLENQLAHAPKGSRKLGVALTVIGIAALGGGAAWYFAGDKTKGGLATMAGGGGLAVGGISVLVF